MGSGPSKENVVTKFRSSDQKENNTWVTKTTQKKEETKEKSVIGNLFGKSKATSNLTKSRTIIDLRSSDSEDEYHQTREDPEAELRDDINSLEKTLSGLGLERRVRQVTLKESRTTAYSSESDAGYLTSSTSVGIGSEGLKKQTRRRKDLRFSWDDKQGGSKKEDWTVKKVIHFVLRIVVSSRIMIGII